jgi:hypothetical protein
MFYTAEKIKVELLPPKPKEFDNTFFISKPCRKVVSGLIPISGMGSEKLRLG